MISPPNLRESLPVVSPLGLRFWDVATGSDVTGGLTVIAHPQHDFARQIQAYRTWSGRYAFRDVWGLRAFEIGRGDDEFWNQPPPARKNLVVEVMDDGRRFLPFSFVVSAPVRGLFTWACAAPGPSPSPEGTVPMFSAPARPIPCGMAAIRTTLRDALHNTPAARAVLEIRMAGKLLAHGLADEAGQLAVICPYPPPTWPELESPPGAQLPFTKQTWPLQFAARYEPWDPEPSLPDLCQTLSQSAASLWADEELTEPFAGATLMYGQELVLRTRKAASPFDMLGELYLTPGGSSPP